MKFEDLNIGEIIKLTHMTGMYEITDFDMEQKRFSFIFREDDIKDTFWFKIEDVEIRISHNVNIDELIII